MGENLREAVGIYILLAVQAIVIKNIRGLIRDRMDVDVVAFQDRMAGNVFHVRLVNGNMDRVHRDAVPRPGS